ncbi:hypothetical protein O6H91_03G070600 [Diphasiastrum complanatum]|uniref:Uncharacterized protein n=1 Tax=Diphasiastrum complanatum TaxID=34168 RepID=A0ACC2E7V1_DIPCM|nr:hypothetical protein O6H91_03G070600 [Diphasiastrum complanatum]
MHRGMLPNEAAVLALKIASRTVEPPLEPSAFMQIIQSSRSSCEYGDLVDAIRLTFPSVEAVSTCFLQVDVLETNNRARFWGSEKSSFLGIDMASLGEFYDAAMKLESAEVKVAIMESSELLISSLFDHLNDGGWPSGSSIVLRTIIVLLENRLFMEPDYHKILIKLWRLILESPSHFRDCVRSALEDYNKDQLERLVAVAQQFITIQLYESHQVNDLVVWGVEMLALLHSANEASQCIGHTSFYNDAVNNEDFDIKEDFKRWRQPERYPFSFCKYPFVYDTSSKSKILQLDATFQMRDEFEDAVLRSIFIGATCPFLILRVKRENLIHDAISQIRRQKDNLKKPLKVQFVGEEGVDEGGVQKEFFQLVVRELFNVKYGMFSYNEETRLFWFNSTPLDMDMEYELVGILLGLAIYNGHILELHFPNIVYKKLLGKSSTFQDLAEVDPQLAEGLSHLLTFKGDIWEVFQRNFQLSGEDIFGNIVTIDLKENGGNIVVTKENRKEYVDLCVEYHMESAIERQFEAFKRGFYKLSKGSVLNLFQPVELEQLICGSPNLDFEALERGTIYEDGYTKNSRCIQDFWEVVHSFNEESKKKLLFFTTGSDRAPIKGLSTLHVVISRNGADSERLPTAHTCFNHLLLPEYESKEKLHERLFTAINNAEGFGLQ